MKILQVQIYRDGGTRQVDTDQGTFFIGIGEQADQVFDGWPNRGGKRCYEHEPRLVEMAEAFNDGQREVVARMYNDWQVGNIAMDYHKYMQETPTPLSFRDWFKTSRDNKNKLQS
jgi:hypothetical protein